MEPQNLKHINKDKVCELCFRHDPLVKDYSSDYDLQTSLRNYLEKTSGDKLSVSDIAHLCDDCYSRVATPAETEEDEDRV